MTDIAAAMGLASLKSFDEKMILRQKLLKMYQEQLAGIDGLTLVGNDFIGKGHAAWLCTVIAENREDLQRKLRENNIESNQVHFRNDRYSVFGGSRCTDCPNMDMVEDKYLILPLHTLLSEDDIERVCQVIKSGW